MPDFPEPMRISPLIKLTRWSLLICGIYYGFGRERYLHHFKSKHKIEEHETSKRIDEMVRAEQDPENFTDCPEYYVPKGVDYSHDDDD